jgi:hypothetical protein
MPIRFSIPVPAGFASKKAAEIAELQAARVTGLRA